MLLCELQATAFENSIDKMDSSSEIFIRRFMKSNIAKRMDDESINEVIKLLQNPDIPFDDIERLTGVKRHTIININNGTH